MQHLTEHVPTPMQQKMPSFEQCFKYEGIAKLEAPLAMNPPKTLWLSHCPPQSILCEDFFFTPVEPFQVGK
jgi:hypothetical protein